MGSWVTVVSLSEKATLALPKWMQHQREIATQLLIWPCIVVPSTAVFLVQFAVVVFVRA